MGNVEWTEIVKEKKKMVGVLNVVVDDLVQFLSLLIYLEMRGFYSVDYCLYLILLNFFADYNSNQYRWMHLLTSVFNWTMFQSHIHYVYFTSVY